MDRISDYGSFDERSNRSWGTIEDAEKDYDSLRVKIPPGRGDDGSNQLNA